MNPYQWNAPNEKTIQNSNLVRNINSPHDDTNEPVITVTSITTLYSILQKPFNKTLGVIHCRLNIADRSTFTNYISFHLLSYKRQTILFTTLNKIQ